jgi:hypothetical protein
LDIKIGAEFRGDKALYSGGDGGVDDFSLVEEESGAYGGNDSILVFQGGCE